MCLQRRPNNLPDKTFGAPVGYAYFDIFNTGNDRSNSVKMVSPKIDASAVANGRVCFSFAVAAFGDGTSTSLAIYRRSGEVDLETEAAAETDPGTTVRSYCL